MNQLMNRDAPQTILIVDDHPLMRKGLAQLIALEESLQLIGEAGTGVDALAMIEARQPALVILDLKMPDMNGLEILTRVKTLAPASRVILFTVCDNEEDVLAALRAGADGYLLKDIEPEDMLDSLKAAARGRLALSHQLTATLAHALRQGDESRRSGRIELTTREREILRLIAACKSNKLIARELDISEATVKVHVKHLLKKLNLSSRVEIAVWAAKEGFKP